MLECLKTLVCRSDHVYWCGDLYAESPAFRIAIDDLPADTIRRIVRETESKGEFEAAVLDAWSDATR